jgi:uncharacterized membrane protein YphA (DoxX/SURF4 family)
VYANVTVGPARQSRETPRDIFLPAIPYLFLNVRKLLLAPLRLLVGWGISPRLLSLLAVTMLVLLRVTIGWHFFSEGAVKQKQGDWSAAPFFANARSPLASYYRDLVWDFDGQIRLDFENTKQHFANYRARVQGHFGFDKKQEDDSWDLYESSQKQIESILNQYAADIEEFKLGRKRLETLDLDPRERAVRDGVDSLGGQRETIRKEWTSKGSEALKQIDLTWSQYEQKLNELANGDQITNHGYVRLDVPRNQLIDTSLIDRFVPYFDMAVGICLLFGFLTPAAALAAAGFLGSVVLSQYPPETGPTSSNYQLIECMACFVLAATGAGRFAGLDYFIHLLIRKFSPQPAVDD